MYVILNLYNTSCLGWHCFFDLVTPLYWAGAAVSIVVTSQVRVQYCTLLCFIDKTRCVPPDSWLQIISHIQISVSSETWSKQDLSSISPGFRAGWQPRLPSTIKLILYVIDDMRRTNKDNQKDYYMTRRFTDACMRTQLIPLCHNRIQPSP